MSNSEPKVLDLMAALHNCLRPDLPPKPAYIDRAPALREATTPKPEALGGAYWCAPDDETLPPETQPRVPASAPAAEERETPTRCPDCPHDEVSHWPLRPGCSVYGCGCTYHWEHRSTPAAATTPEVPCAFELMGDVAELRATIATLRTSLDELTRAAHRYRTVVNDKGSDFHALAAADASLRHALASGGTQT